MFLKFGVISLYEKSFFDRKVTFYTFLNTALKKWYISVALIILSLVLSVIYAATSVKPLYSSTSKLYIVNKGETQLSSSEISVSTSLTKDFEVIVNDTSILNEVSKELNYEYSANQIKDLISVNNPESTRIIELKILCNDKDVAQKVNLAICNILQERVIDIMGIDRISIISQGNLNTQAPLAKQIRIVAYSLFVAIGISFLLIMFISVSNNKISCAKDVEELLELNVLGTIPYNKNSNPRIKKGI